MPTKPKHKSLFESRTMWVNLAVALLGGFTALQGSSYLADHPQVAAIGVFVIGAVNMLLRFVTDRPIKLLVLMAILLGAGTANAQVQLMDQERERVFRSYIPKLNDHRNINAKIDQSILYTTNEIPPAHQFQPIVGGGGTQYTVFYSPKAQLNGSPEPTNGNKEFPWVIGRAGGLHLADPNRCMEFKMLWLPPKPGGGAWPVVVYRGPLDKSHSVNMPVPQQGWRWLFPVDTMFGEVLLKKFADGTWACYEVRLRWREIDDWDADLYRPDVDSLTFVRSTTERLTDKNHDRRAFDRTATVNVLAPIANAADILRGAKFSAIVGTSKIVPTADDHENLVPARYLGAFMQDCRDCHKDTLRHVDSVDSRDWYGQIAGSDGILSWHPIEPSSIGPPDKQVVLRRKFVESGVVEMYDPAKHPASVYQVIPLYDNGPASRYPNTGRRTIRG